MISLNVVNLILLRIVIIYVFGFYKRKPWSFVSHYKAPIKPKKGCYFQTEPTKVVQSNHVLSAFLMTLSWAGVAGKNNFYQREHV